MNSVLSTLLLLCYVFHGGSTTLSVAFLLAQNQPKEKDKELSCELSIPSEIHLIGGYFDATLEITNISDHVVRICTLTQGWRSVGRTTYEEVLRPDLWKSDSPRPEQFSQHIVIIKPAKSVSIPLRIRYYDEILRRQPLTISIGYETGVAFARQYDTWSGSIHSKQVTVNVIESPKPDPEDRNQQVGLDRRE